jgi:hypothetical protein
MLDIATVADKLGLTITSPVEPIPYALKEWPTSLRLSQYASVQCNSVTLWLIVLDWEPNGWLPDVFLLARPLDTTKRRSPSGGRMWLTEQSLFWWEDISNIRYVQEDFDKNKVEMHVLKKIFS